MVLVHIVGGAATPPTRRGWRLDWRRLELATTLQAVHGLASQQLSAPSTCAAQRSLDKADDIIKVGVVVACLQEDDWTG